MTRTRIRASKRTRKAAGQNAARNDQVEEERRRRRARLDELSDSVLDVPAGTTEVIGTPAEQPDLSDREKANEVYVKTFNQEVGE